MVPAQMTLNAKYISVSLKYFVVSTSMKYKNSYFIEFYVLIQLQLSYFLHHFDMV